MTVALVLILAACGDDATSAGVADSAADVAPSDSDNIITPGPPPDIDVSQHDVPLDDVHFDTFDGGSVTLADSDAQLRARLLDAIPPINDPVYGSAEDGAWLEPSDLVLGYVSSGTAYAYPFKIMNFHEIVNDVIDGIPVLISYCPLCRSAIVFDRTIDGEVVTFSNTSALYDSDMVMVDRGTGSYWWQVAGRAIVGPLTGTELQPLPSSVDTWEGWTREHPDTNVLTRDSGFLRPYERDVFVGYEERVNDGQFAFPVGEAARDHRLPAAELVVGVELGGEVRAYPVVSLTGELRDEVGDVPIIVVPRDGGADVFAVADDGGPGDPIPTRTTFWFALIGAFPDATVGR